MRKLCFLILLFAFSKLSAQEKDFRTWYNLGSEYKLSDKWSLDISDEFRLRENSSIPERNQFEMGFSYKINSKWSTSFAYRNVYENPFSEYYVIGHRLRADISRKWKPMRYEISFRVRLINDPEDASFMNGFFNDIIHREKLSIRYNLPKTSLTPEISGEWYFNLNNSPFLIQKSRYFGGFTYKLDKRNRIGMYAGGQWYQQKSVPESHFVLLFDYVFKFN